MLGGQARARDAMTTPAAGQAPAPDAPVAARILGGPPRDFTADDVFAAHHRALLSADALAEAVEAAIEGDAAGWRVLFDRFYPDVHAYARARLNDTTEAEEVAQEVFVASVKAVRGLRERREPAVRAWFLHICRNKVADHLRRRYREQKAPTPVAAVTADPGEVAVNRLRAAEVRRAMEGLTDDQRDVVVRRFVLDQSLEEVAAATGRSVGAVKAMQHRALASLGALLEGSSAA